VAEGFFAVGPWFRQTRKPSVILAAIFHAGIFLVMARTLMIFSTVMWAGLLAFVDDGKDWWSQEDRVAQRIKSELKGAPAGQPSGNWVQNLWALALIVVLIAFPARIFFWTGRTLDTISYSDRHPGGYSMFLMKDRVLKAILHYQDDQNHWHSEVLLQRFASLSNDNNLYSLARHAFKDHLDAQRVRVEITYTVNESRLMTKTLDFTRNSLDNPPPVIAVNTPLVPIDLDGLVDKAHESVTSLSN